MCTGETKKEKTQRGSAKEGRQESVKSSNKARGTRAAPSSITSNFTLNSSHLATKTSRGYATYKAQCTI